MIPVKQTKLQNENQHGNCMRACMASMFEIDIDEIKPFEDLFGDSEWGTLFIQELDRLGYEYEGCCEFSDLNDYEGVDGFIMVGGTTVRTTINGVEHAVIWKDNKIVHDPHPSNDSLLEIKDAYLIKRKSS